jgi:hypothetical protein
MFVPAISERMPWYTPPVKVPPSTSTTTAPAPTAPAETPAVDDPAAVTAGQKTVEDFYAAINAGSMEGIARLLTPGLAADLDPGQFEGWQSTTFEFTRGWFDAGSVTIIGRESLRQFGSGEDGGVKYVLSNVNGAWLISEWPVGVDRTQVEGADTTGSSSGVSGTLSDASARDIVTKLLNARMVGNANAVRQLTTAKFQADNGDIWLDGRDSREYFYKFKVTSVAIEGNSATVSTSEDWNSGTELGTYPSSIRVGPCSSTRGARPRASHRQTRRARRCSQVVRLPAHDAECAVDLLEQDDPAQLMGKGHP